MRTLNDDIPGFLKDIHKMTGMDTSGLEKVCIKHVKDCPDPENKKNMLSDIEDYKKEGIAIPMMYGWADPFTIYRFEEEPYEMLAKCHPDDLELEKEWLKEQQAFTVHELIHVIDEIKNGYHLIEFKAVERHNELLEQYKDLNKKLDKGDLDSFLKKNSDNGERFIDYIGRLGERIDHLDEKIDVLEALNESHAMFIECRWTGDTHGINSPDEHEFEDYIKGQKIIRSAYDQGISIKTLYRHVPSMDELEKTEQYFQRIKNKGFL